MFDYPVVLTPDGDTVLVTFPDVPEAITFGVDDDDIQITVDQARALTK
jgi:antitoxin HicB